MDIYKIIVFLSVIIVFFYMIKLLFFVKKRWKLRIYKFIILITGLGALSIGTFLYMALFEPYNICMKILIRVCFTLGAILYATGVILWSDYARKLILKFEEMSLRDSMTRIYNRKGIEEIYNQISENNKQFYLLFCDLDGLKMINDKFGHLRGDKYIASAAMIIIDAVNMSGCVGRIGGDEFLIILEHHDEVDLMRISNLIKASVHNIFPEKNTGISIGSASFPEDGSTMEELISVADKRMYIDKKDNNSHFELYYKAKYN